MAVTTAINPALGLYTIAYFGTALDPKLRAGGVLRGAVLGPGAAARVPR
jgi:hypothetical protein